LDYLSLPESPGLLPSNERFMGRRVNWNQPPSAEVAAVVGALISISLVAIVGAIGPPSSLASVATLEAPPASASFSEEDRLETPALHDVTPTSPQLSTPVVTSRQTATATASPTPTKTRRPTATPTLTLDLASCNAAGCGSNAVALPTAEYASKLLLRNEPAVRRVCETCPKNGQLSEAELDTLVSAGPDVLARLQNLTLSQETHQLAPGIVYIAFDYVHHVVIDLEESGYILRNIIPNDVERGTLITPSYCLSPQSLVVIDADYHGLDGSNRTETGRDLFFHLGRAALFKRDGRFDIDVIREREEYDQTTISWGGGPIFMRDGQYDFDPEQEWFDPESLDYYAETRWAKVTVALSKDRKYLFLSVSFGLTLEEHAQNIIELGNKWGIEVDRAMRFDGGESAYLALRMDDYLVPVLDIEEPLIVNCLAIERSEQP
jgi:hypothetical protein